MGEYGGMSPEEHAIIMETEGMSPEEHALMEERAKLEDEIKAQRLDAWLKGPVYYGSDLTLRVAETRDAVTFALQVDGDERPAIVGRLLAGSIQY